MNSDEALKLENQACFRLYSATNTVIRAYRPLLEVLDLTYSQYLVMMVLWEQDAINVKTLGQKLHLDSGTLTPMLKRLENKGLLLRKRSETDERGRQLFLTESGKALKEQASRVPEAIFCKQGLTLDELAALRKLCDKIIVSGTDSG